MTRLRHITARMALGILLVCLLASTAAWAKDDPAPAGAEATDAASPAPPRTSRLQGRAALDRRTPVIGATVKVRKEDDLSRLILTSTDGKGVFRVDGLPDGSYDVELTREGLETIVKSDVSVRFPFRAVVEVKMTPAEDASPAGKGGATAAAPMTSDPLTLRGEVRDLEGEGVGEVRLRFVRLDGSADPLLVRSDPDGKFEVAGLSDGEWRVEIWGVGFLAVRQTLRLTGDTRLDVVLVEQPGDYEPTPLELMPPERPVPPPGLDDL